MDHPLKKLALCVDGCYAAEIQGDPTPGAGAWGSRNAHRANQRAPDERLGCLTGALLMRPLAPLRTALAPSRKANVDGHGPNLLRTSSRIAITDATERACLHWLHARCAPLQFSKSTGEPPLLTGTSSSSSKASGCPAGSVASMGSPHIQHGSPSARTRRTSASRPERRRGFRFGTSRPPIVSRMSRSLYVSQTKRCRMVPHGSAWC